VNAIWEGSGNVMCLDVLRAIAHEGDRARGLLTELAAQTEGLANSQDAVAAVETVLAPEADETAARALTETLAVLAAAAALRECAPEAIAAHFARRFLEPHRNRTIGSGGLSAGDARAVLERALPA
jgi:putative acyl-CoA dehydrogenase